MERRLKKGVQYIWVFIARESVDTWYMNCFKKAYVYRRFEWEGGILLQIEVIDDVVVNILGVTHFL